MDDADLNILALGMDLTGSRLIVEEVSLRISRFCLFVFFRRSLYIIDVCGSLPCALTVLLDRGRFMFLSDFDDYYDDDVEKTDTSRNC